MSAGMKENVLDVLMYLFQNYMGDDEDADPDRESIQTELLAAGFPSREIQQAFEWLDSLVDRQAIALPVNPSSCRIYVAPELAKLDVECQGFLLFLEQSGILNSETRELVIDRVMALEADDIGLHQLKWIVLMLLFNQPGQEEACAWLEDLVLDSPPGYLH
jgi:Smg protein